MNKRRSTFTLDEETERALRRSAERLGKSKSEIVREAIQEYDARAGRLSEVERLRLLAAFDEHVPRLPERPLAEVEAELQEIRRARRGGGRGGNRPEDATG
ncbi:MAG: ribbon-helix-helix protein, CopG family [Acidobacteriota bacterium]|nr:ribbon-helix-helix protein, CopG family [Acidobacteriota bacterium]